MRATPPTLDVNARNASPNRTVNHSAQAVIRHSLTPQNIRTYTCVTCRPLSPGDDLDLGRSRALLLRERYLIALTNGSLLSINTRWHTRSF